MITFRPNFNISSFKRFANITSPLIRSAAPNNLAPLACDTVSFTGKTVSLKKKDEPTKQELIDMRMLARAIHNESACKQVSQDSGLTEIKFSEAFLPYFEDLTMQPNSKTKRPIYKILTRTKTPSSVKEKLIERYVMQNSIEKSKNDSLDCLFDTNYISKTLGDLVGCRIVLGSCDTNAATPIIDAMIRAVQDGVLRVDKIENYISFQVDSKYKYVQEGDLERLRDAVNEQRVKNNLEPIDITYSPKKTGYMALHIDADLSNFSGKPYGKGHKGEIQLIGYDVSKLKDIEDLCYKLKNRNEKGEAIKEIKSGHYAYKPFEKHFYNCLDDENYPNISDSFLLYTQRAYLAQRLKPDVPNLRRSSRRVYKYPTIEECGLKGQLPKALDFNVLAKVKEACDVIYQNSPEGLI